MILDWLILVLLVPAILVPIVLLCGFAGCPPFAQRCVGDADCPVGTRCVDGQCVASALSSAPSAPEDLQANAVSDSEIDLSWTDTEPAVTSFQVERAREGEDFAAISNPTGPTFQDTGLEAGTTFLYQVRALVGQEFSEPSNQATATTLFTTAFDVSTLVPSDLPGGLPPGDYCFVQRISAGLLLADGVKVGLKVRGSPAGNGTINNIYISRAVPAGSGNDWDSAGDLTPIITSALTLPDDQPSDLNPIDYNLDQTQDLIIAFDFTATSSGGNIPFVLQPGVTIYFKPGVQQASIQTRDPDYVSQVDPLYLVVTIGVA